jgi:eukaryotic-like serine/threonine-protein kinase
MASEILDEKAIFNVARQIGSPDARVAYLRQACGPDPGLRERVQDLLHAYEEQASFLESPPPVGVATVDELLRETAGTVIGPYKLSEPIGEGGMGAVWMAQQTEPVKRLVAIKLIKAGMDSKQVIARFEAERQALALMDHPNIARVLEAGTTSTGRPYFVMDLVKGVPITKYCDEHRLTPRQRLELFIPVGQAVQHAHQKGIIHRDLKPSNVLVALYDGKPVPKVIDFGVAKATGQTLTEKTLVTGFGALVGTLEYMSPEQAEINQLDIDTRSDIYALGVLLYELLAGSPPFTRNELEKSGGMLEMLRVIREQEPTKPSTKLSTAEGLLTLAANRGTEPAKLTKLLRGELDWIVMKALEKDRNRRYETANGFAMDVRRYLDDEPVLACPPSAGYRLRKFARRNKGRLAVTSGLFLALTVMAATIGWAVRDRAARQAENDEAEISRRAIVESQVRDSLNMTRTLIGENKLAAAREKLAQATAQLGNDGSALGNLAAEVEAGTAEVDKFQRFLDRIDQAHQAETAPLLEAAVGADGSPSGTGTPALVKIGERRPAAAVPFLLEALQLYGIPGRDDWTSTLEGGLLGKQQVEQIHHLAYEELLWLADDVLGRQQEHRSGQKLSPEAAARQALVYLGKAESARRPTQAFFALRASCHRALREEAAAQADTEAAAKAPPAMALDHVLRGQVAYDAKQLAEGVQAFEAALRLEPTHYWSMMKLGYCWCDHGRGPEDFARAVTAFTGCILKRPDHAHAYYSRAVACSRLGRDEEALDDFSKAIELDPKHVFARYNRGIIHNRLGRPDKAVTDFSRAIELDPKDVPAWYNRGNAYYKLGQPDKAVTDYSMAIELNPKYVPAWYKRGAVYNTLGQPDKAQTDSSKAVELDPKHAPAWTARGAAYNQLGQADKAIADFSRAIELDPKYAPAWNNRGTVYNTLGQTDKAVTDYSKAVELDPKYALAWYNRGAAYNKLGQPDKALTDLSQAIELNPKDADAWYSRGNAYDKLGQPDKALTDLSQAVELNPKYAKAWNNRGTAHNKLGQPDKAVADFSRAVELDPKYALAWYNRGNAYDKRGQLNKAVTDYSMAIELNQKYAPAWYNRGNVYRRLGQLDKGVADYSRALELDSKFAMAWNNRGLAYNQLGQPDKAVADFLKAVQLGPKVGSYRQNLGVAHYRAGDWKAAVAALDKSRQLGQGGDAVDWLCLAMARWKLGHHDEAHKAYAQAVRWLEKNKETLEKDKTRAEELRRFRAEAEEVLEQKKQ